MGVQVPILSPGDRVLLAMPITSDAGWEAFDELLRSAYPNVRFDPIFANVAEPRVIFVYRGGSHQSVQVPTETSYLGVKER